MRPNYIWIPIFHYVGMLTHDQLLGYCWEDRFNQPILTFLFLLIFKLEGKKELHEEVKSYGVPLGVLTDNIPILI